MTPLRIEFSLIKPLAEFVIWTGLSLYAYFGFRKLAFPPDVEWVRMLGYGLFSLMVITTGITLIHHWIRRGEPAIIAREDDLTIQTAWRSRYHYRLHRQDIEKIYLHEQRGGARMQILLSEAAARRIGKREISIRLMLLKGWGRENVRRLQQWLAPTTA